jgi:uncharacterized membrane protein YhaH (DUF805 family)
MTDPETIIEKKKKGWLKWLDWENIQKILFSPRGRINSRTYIFYFSLLNILNILILSMFLLLFQTKDTILPQVIIGIPFIIPLIIIWIKRFQDVWKNWRNLLFLLVPIYNIIIWLNLLFQKWNNEDNKYWIKPNDISQKMKIITVILFILYIATNFI